MKKQVFGIILVLLVVSFTLVFSRANSVHAAGLTRVQGPCIATSSGTSVFVNLIRPVDNDGLVAVITSGSFSSIKTVSSLSEDNVKWYLVVSSSVYDSHTDYLDVEIWAANVSTPSAGTTIMASFSGSCEEGNTITVCEYSGLYPFVSMATATNSGGMSWNPSSRGMSAAPDTGTTASTSAQLDVGGLVQYAGFFSNPTNGFTMSAMVYTTTTYGHGAAYLERQLSQTGTVNSGVTSNSGNTDINPPWAGAMATFSSPNWAGVVLTGTQLPWYLWTNIALGITIALFACTTFYYRKKALTGKESKKVVAKPLPRESKTCPNCGANLPADSKFCGKCGTPLEDSLPPK